ncbi:MAG: tRNA uridine-5-carboxymethylaminomethyl(34) synthesis GTPase MnmE, partial [Clostridia bacterium]|nr:tRNA uridine-5-carboxymethylaminomethyl(34) synthesis GTPase MnmE [Clostridia bacterium]
MNTIAAISTPAGNGGIGIIRISGNDALEIINRIWIPVKKGDFKPFSVRLGNIVDESGEVVDQVLVSYFKAPKSYTGEDICEINCHGGNVSMQRILDIVLRNGAFLAEPGEFTKRAFLNGKMDLTQAEAVIDLINSKSEKEGKASVKQLEGKLGTEIRNIKDEIINLLADIEANIDYPEYEDIEEVRREKIIEIIEKQILKLKKLENSFESGKILKNGVLTAIIGKPNVGKSSLLNVLLKEERAIVTEIPGTTRDTIEEYVNIKGITLRLIDTAGIRKTDDVVENIGVEKSKKAIDEAELILFLIDGSSKLSHEDLELYQLIKDKPHIILINKVDIEQSKLDMKEFESDEDNMIRISAKTSEGIEQLENKIEELFNLKNLETENELIITNIRHKDLIMRAKEGLENANIAISS